MASINNNPRINFRDPGQRRRSFGARLLHLVFGVFAIWLLGLLAFVAAIPGPGVDVETPSDRTDAIIVLTGGSDRLAEGFSLLDRGLAKRLLISGVAPGVKMEQLIERLGDQGSAAPAVSELSCCVTLGYLAESTAGNAAESAEWLHQNGSRSVRLVTANYHMLRSLLEFRRFIPDIAVVPNPVFPAEVRNPYWFVHPKTVMLIVNEYHKFLIAFARALPSETRHWVSSVAVRKG